MSLGPGSVYHAAVLRTEGPSDKMSQDIPEWWAPSSRARAGIPPERRGNGSLWNLIDPSEDQAKASEADLVQPVPLCRHTGQTSIL
ncbi:hypothetical protein PBY51_006576 [Eleginops maclovinus]|uniref:Uncharacterized protein n=1 Tax=Eleginops maclovinus TaxID=56733 RepID=A0AAN8A4V7_ELEMC|nr:hypothetical protein PBY51_006576 [Eleginops maclovinus]